MSELFKRGGKVEPLLTGIGQASTFTGFCAEHDAQLFRPLETVPFAASREQLTLLAYRAVARELFTKRGMLRLMPRAKQLDRGRARWAQRVIQSQFSGMEAGAQLGLRDLERHKQALDACLANADWGSVHGYVIEIDSTPSFLCSGALLPEVDFRGNVLQTFGDAQIHLDLIAFSILPTETGGAFVFSWVGDQPACDALVQSLDRVPAEELPSALTRFTFEFFENIALSPSWWEGLPSDVRDSLNQRFISGAMPFQERQPECLLPDGVRAVQWNVTRKSFTSSTV